jgi:hypothetical protein
VTSSVGAMFTPIAEYPYEYLLVVARNWVR